jgi:hypothetical protein
MAVFLDLAPCGQVSGRFGLTYCLHSSEKHKLHRVDACIYNPKKRDDTNVLSLQKYSASEKNMEST